MRTPGGRWVAVVAAALVGVLAAVPGPAHGQSQAQGVANGYGHLLDHPQHGRAALAALGTQVDEAAARNHVSRQRLESLLADDTAWVDVDGRVFFVDPPRVSPSTARTTAARTTTASAGAAATDPPAPPSDAFVLHSRPGAATRIFLDFDGAHVEGTDWNTQMGDRNVPAGDYAGWSLDGDPATFTDAERAVVVATWAEVAEDFAPFRVDVTTQDPGPDAMRRATPSDPSYGMHVLVTGADPASTHLCDGCSGLAYIGVFDQVSPGSDPSQPAWVFGSTLFGNPHYLADAISHEVGHTFGLAHDGYAETSAGAGDGADYYKTPGAWGPVMGAAYNPLTEWSDGDYARASNQEDDVAVIAAHGAPLLTDDHGSTAVTATALPSPAAVSVPGTIGTRADVDVFRVPPCPTARSATVTPAGTGPDLDPSLSLVDESGATLVSADPAGPVSATVSVPAAGGLLRVDGVGRASTYSDYGSLGSYVLTVAACPGGATVTPAPSLPRDLAADPVPGTRSLVLTWSPPAVGTVDSYVVSRPGLPDIPLVGSTRTMTLLGLPGASDVPFSVRAINGTGSGPTATQTGRTPVYPPTRPQELVASTDGQPDGVVQLDWSPPADQGGGTFTGYDVTVTPLDPAGPEGPADWVAAGEDRSRHVGGLEEGHRYRLTVYALYDDEPGDPVRYLRGDPAAVDLTYAPPAPPPVEVTPPPPPPPVVVVAPTRPGAPHVGRASSGAAGGTISATARWAAPSSNGGSAVTGYRVTALRMSSTGVVVRRTTVTTTAAARSKVVRLAKGRYRFTVAAVNRVGTGRSSARSALVTAR